MAWWRTTDPAGEKHGKCPQCRKNTIFAEDKTASLMKLTLAAMTFSLLGLFSCKSYTDLSVADFESMLSEDQTVQLVDVRTPEEYTEGHIAGAVNIDWYGSDFLEKAKELLSRERPVMVYCRSGRRSASASRALSTYGYPVYNLKDGYLAWTAAGKPVSGYAVEHFRTPSGKAVDVTLIKHGSLEIRYGGISVQVDPVLGLGKPTDYGTEFPKADVILMTHEHHDHFDREAIAALMKEDTQLVSNVNCVEALGWGTALSNGNVTVVAGDIKVEAVPAYNTTPGREQFHPKGRDNGYVLTVDGLRIYIAGDTEDIPEMSELEDIDVAFLPVNQPYTMTPEQCIAAAKVIRPKVLIPYHYGQTDVSGIPAALPDIDVRIRQMQ